MKQLFITILLLAGIMAAGQPTFNEIGLTITRANHTASHLRVSLYPLIQRDSARVDVYSIRLTDEVINESFLLKSEEDYPVDAFRTISKHHFDNICKDIAVLSAKHVLEIERHEADDGNLYYFNLVITSSGESMKFCFSHTIGGLLEDPSPLARICRDIMSCAKIDLLDE